MRTLVALPDLHIPQHDVRSLNAVNKFLKDYRPDEIVYMGDFMDFDCISSHNKDNLRAVENERIFEDYETATPIIDLHRKLTKKITYIEGNHCERVERYVDANPAVKGLVEVVPCLKLKQKNIDFIRYRNTGVYKVGRANFIHGIYTNQFHAKKTVEAFGDNIFYGHTHDVQSYSKELRGVNKTLVGQSMGCLCKYNQSYMKGRPSRWQQAFGVFEFLPDGFFQYQVVRIFNHRFIYNGKIYEG